jgi:hypothetical protein
MMVHFVGLKTPAMDVPLIELEPRSGKLVDLYNDCDLHAVTFSASGLAFDFLPNKSRMAHESRSIAVLFRNIQNLRVEQPRDWAPEESSQIDHLLIRQPGPWPQVVFKAGGLEFEFDCAEMVLEVSVP